MKQCIIIIIILSLIIIGLISGIVWYHSYTTKQNEVFTEKLKEAEKQRQDNIITKTVTITIFKTLPDTSKDQKYADALSIIDSDTSYIQTQNKKIIDLNNQLSKSIKKYNINGFGSIGFNQEFQMRTSIGLTFNRIFLNSFYLGFGGSFDQYYPYNNGFNKTLLGGSILLQIGFSL